MKQNLFFSIIVCTYNRRKILEKNIKSLLKQSLDPENFEIIIMDDGSTDGTQNYIESLIKKTKNPKIYLHSQKNKGLAYSRNIAAKTAKGIYVAFIDDDALADKNWLKNTLGIINRVKPVPIGITGPVEAYFEIEKPSWFKDEYVNDIKGSKDRFLEKGESFSGPNMILKKDLIYKYGGFDESVDMKGEIIMVGEETRLFERMWEKNEKIKLFYSPKVIVKHLVHPYKFSIKYNLKRWYAAGQSYYIRNKKRSGLKILILATKVLGYVFVSTGFALISIPKYRKYQNWLVERIGPLMFSLGFIAALAHIRHKMKHYSRK